MRLRLRGAATSFDGLVFGVGAVSGLCHPPTFLRRKPPFVFSPFM